MIMLLFTPQRIIPYLDRFFSQRKGQIVYNKINLGFIVTALAMKRNIQFSLS